MGDLNLSNLRNSVTFSRHILQKVLSETNSIFNETDKIPTLRGVYMTSLWYGQIKPEWSGPLALQACPIQRPGDTGWYIGQNHRSLWLIIFLNIENWKPTLQSNLCLLFQVRLMERRLGEVEWSPTEQSVKADEYQKAAFEKEKVIKTLEGEVESQVERLEKWRLIQHKWFHYLSRLTKNNIAQKRTSDNFFSKWQFSQRVDLLLIEDVVKIWGNIFIWTSGYCNLRKDCILHKTSSMQYQTENAKILIDDNLWPT